jgi:hypothetical protein
VTTVVEEESDVDATMTMVMARRVPIEWYRPVVTSCTITLPTVSGRFGFVYRSTTIWSCFYDFAMGRSKTEFATVAFCFESFTRQKKCKCVNVTCVPGITSGAGRLIEVPRTSHRYEDSLRRRKQVDTVVDEIDAEEPAVGLAPAHNA